ncbi:MAG: restriction endonuclease, partial [Planctomycetia bacterium]|nr:restriction endonuclease [Planctomycetia bacterium]
MSPTVREQGKLFEKFVRQYLRCSKTYQNLTDVWMWSDFPFRGKLPDTGIDLVCKTEDGEFWAVQCKFYEENSQIAKGDVDSFLSASAMAFLDEEGKSRQFVYRLVFATADLSSNAKETLEKQVVAAGVLHLEDLDDAGIDWATFWEGFDTHMIRGMAEEFTLSVQEPPKELRPHQQKALEDVLRGFETDDRG